jgi:hypothetical protein
MRISNAYAALFCAASMCAPPWVAAQTVSSFTVVNADTGADIATFTGAGTVSIAATPRINVRANASNVKSVVLTEGGSRKVENAAPYALKGDSNGVYAKWSPAAGTYVINATPFAGSSGSGAAGPTVTLALTIVTTPVAGGAPTVNAGPDGIGRIPLPSGSSAFFSGSASDPGGNIVSFLWTQVSGPNQAVLPAPTFNGLQASGLVVGTYTFRLTATDNDGNSASDDVNFTVLPEGGLTVNAGPDQSLPSGTTTASLSGSASDVIAAKFSYLWTQVSGPRAEIASFVASATQVSGLVAGTYTFRLKVFNGPASNTDDVNITVASGQPQTGTGKLIIDPESVHHFVYDRDKDGDGKRDPAYLAGSGGPEGFLYLSAARKQFIINKLVNTATVNSSVNGLYFHSMRSFGGDANNDSEAPFIDNSNARSGIDFTKLDSWYVDLKRLDDAGVTLWFTLFDDGAIPYGCKYNDEYKNYATTVVNRFKDLKHLIWITQEEYRWTNDSQADCTLDDNDQRQIGLAAAIRAADPVHPIATHHMGGQAMQFPNDPNIRVFGQQATVKSPAEMHDKAGKQGWGNWVYVMAEAHPWHKERIEAGDRNALRKSNWATALSGGYVMMYDSFESNDPTDAMLDDLRRLKVFMESTAFNRMTPLFDTALGDAKLDNTKYLLANQGQGLYILYGEFDAGKMGVRGAPAGAYALKWFDPVSGQTVDQTATVAVDGIASFTKPASFGPEVALSMRKQ